MMVRTDKSEVGRHSTVSAMGRECKVFNSLAFRKIRLAVAAIDGGAKVMGISGGEMYERLNRQGLISGRLLGKYEMLHTQSERFVIEDTVETLKNWEAERR